MLGRLLGNYYGQFQKNIHSAQESNNEPVMCVRISLHCITVPGVNHVSTDHVDFLGLPCSESWNPLVVNQPRVNDSLTPL